MKPWPSVVRFEKAKKQFKEVSRTLEAFEYWFGPYPFYEDSYKLVEVPYLGMEHQSSVTYGNGYQNGYKGIDFSSLILALVIEGVAICILIILYGGSIPSIGFVVTWAFVSESATRRSRSTFLHCEYLIPVFLIQWCTHGTHSTPIAVKILKHPWVLRYFRCINFILIYGFLAFHSYFQCIG